MADPRNTFVCCMNPTQHTQIVPSPMAADFTKVELILGIRKQGEAWPRCHVRSVRQQFDWCEGQGRWEFGEQRVCDVHADILREGGRLFGLYPDGKWCLGRRTLADEMAAAGAFSNGEPSG